MEEHFLPSEVARLILGYLIEKKLHRTFRTFMNECPDLAEYWQVLKNGRIPCTTIMGQSLNNILNDYAVMKLNAVRSGQVSNRFVVIREQGTSSDNTRPTPAIIQTCKETEESMLAQKDRQKAVDAKRISHQRRKRKKEQPKPFSARSGDNETNGMGEPSHSRSEAVILASEPTGVTSMRTASSTLALEEVAIADGRLTPPSYVARTTENPLFIGDEADANLRKDSDADDDKVTGSKRTGSESTKSHSRKSSSDSFEFLDRILEETHLPERLAEYINTARMGSLTDIFNDGGPYNKDEPSVVMAAGPAGGTEIVHLDNTTGKAVDINQIIEMTEQDPAFQSFLQMFQQGSAIPISSGDIPVLQPSAEPATDQSHNPVTEVVEFTPSYSENLPVSHTQVLSCEASEQTQYGARRAVSNSDREKFVETAKTAGLQDELSPAPCQQLKCDSMQTSVNFPCEQVDTENNIDQVNDFVADNNLEHVPSSPNPNSKFQDDQSVQQDLSAVDSSFTNHSENNVRESSTGLNDKEPSNELSFASHLESIVNPEKTVLPATDRELAPSKIQTPCQTTQASSTTLSKKIKHFEGITVTPDENSLTVFSFIEKKTAEMNGEKFVHRSQRNFSTAEAANPVQMSEYSNKETNFTSGTCDAQTLSTHPQVINLSVPLCDSHQSLPSVNEQGDNNSEALGKDSVLEEKDPTCDNPNVSVNAQTEDSNVKAYDKHEILRITSSKGNVIEDIHSNEKISHAPDTPNSTLTSEDVQVKSSSASTDCNAVQTTGVVNVENNERTNTESSSTIVSSQEGISVKMDNIQHILKADRSINVNCDKTNRWVSAEAAENSRGFGQRDNNMELDISECEGSTKRENLVRSTSITAADISYNNSQITLGNLLDPEASSVHDEELEIKARNIETIDECLIVCLSDLASQSNTSNSCSRKTRSRKKKKRSSKQSHRKLSEVENDVCSKAVTEADRQTTCSLTVDEDGKSFGEDGQASQNSDIVVTVGESSQVCSHAEDTSISFCDEDHNHENPECSAHTRSSQIRKFSSSHKSVGGVVSDGSDSDSFVCVDDDVDSVPIFPKPKKNRVSMTQEEQGSLPQNNRAEQKETSSDALPGSQEDISQSLTEKDFDRHHLTPKKPEKTRINTRLKQQGSELSKLQGSFTPKQAMSLNGLSSPQERELTLKYGHCSTLSSPPYIAKKFVDDNSPQQLMSHRNPLPNSSSLPARPTFQENTGLLSPPLKPTLKGRQSAFRPVQSQQSPMNSAEENRSLSLSEKTKRTVISVNSEITPFIPKHCKKNPTRRIKPVEVSYSTPSPLQDFPSSPMSFVIDLPAYEPNSPAAVLAKDTLRQSGVGKPIFSPERTRLKTLSTSCTSAELHEDASQGKVRPGWSDEKAQENPGLSSSQLTNFGDKLPPSPSRRRPRRIKTVQLSTIAKKECSATLASVPPVKMPIRSPVIDDAKLVSSTSDVVTESQADAVAFRMLKAIASSYSKPQPCQEISSTNQTLRLSKCGCVSRSNCKHRKGTGKKLSLPKKNLSCNDDPGYCNESEKASTEEMGGQAVSSSTLKNVTTGDEISSFKRDVTRRNADTSVKVRNAFSGAEQMPKSKEIVTENAVNSRSDVSSPASVSSDSNTAFAVVGTMEILCNKIANKDGHQADVQSSKRKSVNESNSSIIASASSKCVSQVSKQTAKPTARSSSLFYEQVSTNKEDLSKNIQDLLQENGKENSTQDTVGGLQSQMEEKKELQKVRTSNFPSCSGVNQNINPTSKENSVVNGVRITEVRDTMIPPAKLLIKKHVTSTADKRSLGQSVPKSVNVIKSGDSVRECCKSSSEKHCAPDLAASSGHKACKLTTTTASSVAAVEVCQTSASDIGQPGRNAIGNAQGRLASTTNGSLTKAPDHNQKLSVTSHAIPSQADEPAMLVSDYNETNTSYEQKRDKEMNHRTDNLLAQSTVANLFVVTCSVPVYSTSTMSQSASVFGSFTDLLNASVSQSQTNLPGCISGALKLANNVESSCVPEYSPVKNSAATIDQTGSQGFADPEKSQRRLGPRCPSPSDVSILRQAMVDCGIPMETSNLTSVATPTDQAMVTVTTAGSSQMPVTPDGVQTLAYTGTGGPRHSQLILTTPVNTNSVANISEAGRKTRRSKIQSKTVQHSESLAKLVPQLNTRGDETSEESKLQQLSSAFNFAKILPKIPTPTHETGLQKESVSNIQIVPTSTGPVITLPPSFQGILQKLISETQSSPVSPSQVTPKPPGHALSDNINSQYNFVNVETACRTAFPDEAAHIPSLSSQNCIERTWATPNSEIQKVKKHGIQKSKTTANATYANISTHHDISPQLKSNRKSSISRKRKRSRQTEGIETMGGKLENLNHDAVVNMQGEEMIRPQSRVNQKVADRTQNTFTHLKQAQGLTNKKQGSRKGSQKRVSTSKTPHSEKAQPSRVLLRDSRGKFISRKTLLVNEKFPTNSEVQRSAGISGIERARGKDITDKQILLADSQLKINLTNVLSKDDNSIQAATKKSKKKHRMNRTVSSNREIGIVESGEVGSTHDVLESACERVKNTGRESGIAEVGEMGSARDVIDPACQRVKNTDGEIDIVESCDMENAHDVIDSACRRVENTDRESGITEIPEKGSTHNASESVCHDVENTFVDGESDGAENQCMGNDYHILESESQSRTEICSDGVDFRPPDTVRDKELQRSGETVPVCKSHVIECKSPARKKGFEELEEDANDQISEKIYKKRLIDKSVNGTSVNSEHESNEMIQLNSRKMDDRISAPSQSTNQLAPVLDVKRQEKNNSSGTIHPDSTKETVSDIICISDDHNMDYVSSQNSLSKSSCGRNSSRSPCKKRAKHDASPSAPYKSKEHHTKKTPPPRKINVETNEHKTPQSRKRKRSTPLQRTPKHRKLELSVKMFEKRGESEEMSSKDHLLSPEYPKRKSRLSDSLTEALENTLKKSDNVDCEETEKRMVVSPRKNVRMVVDSTSGDIIEEGDISPISPPLFSSPEIVQSSAVTLKTSAQASIQSCDKQPVKENHCKPGQISCKTKGGLSRKSISESDVDSKSTPKKPAYSYVGSLPVGKLKDILANVASQTTADSDGASNKKGKLSTKKSSKHRSKSSTDRKSVSHSKEHLNLKTASSAIASSGDCLHESSDEKMVSQTEGSDLRGELDETEMAAAVLELSMREDEGECSESPTHKDKSSCLSHKDGEAPPSVFPSSVSFTEDTLLQPDEHSQGHSHKSPSSSNSCATPPERSKLPLKKRLSSDFFMIGIDDPSDLNECFEPPGEENSSSAIFPPHSELQVTVLSSENAAVAAPTSDEVLAPATGAAASEDTSQPKDHTSTKLRSRRSLNEVISYLSTHETPETVPPDNTNGSLLKTAPEEALLFDTSTTNQESQPQAPQSPRQTSLPSPVDQSRVSTSTRESLSPAVSDSSSQKSASKSKINRLLKKLYRQKKTTP